MKGGSDGGHVDDSDNLDSESPASLLSSRRDGGSLGGDHDLESLASLLSSRRYDGREGDDDSDGLRLGDGVD